MEEARAIAFNEIEIGRREAKRSIRDIRGGLLLAGRDFTRRNAADSSRSTNPVPRG